MKKWRRTLPQTEAMIPPAKIQGFEYHVFFLLPRIIYIYIICILIDTLHSVIYCNMYK